jgi:hypothetical protein
MQPGRTCSINYNTGTHGSPTWVAIGRASSPSRTQSRPTSRRTYRSAPTSRNVTGVMDYEISFTYVQSAAAGLAADTVLTALLASFTAGTVMDIAMLSGPAATTGSTGIRGPFVVSEITKNEDDEDAVAYDVTLVEVDSTDFANGTVPFTVGP